MSKSALSYMLFKGRVTLGTQVEPKANGHIGGRSCQLSLQGATVADCAHSSEFRHILSCTSCASVDLSPWCPLDSLPSTSIPRPSLNYHLSLS